MLNSGKIIQKTKDLVEVPSWEDEKKAAKYVKDLVSGEIDEVGNVFASKGSGKPEIALVSHLDTVPPSSGENKVYSKDGRIYGRGSADMKGPLISMAMAFNDVEPQRGKITFASMVGEETDARGIRHAISKGFIPDYAIIGEGTASYSEKGNIDVCIGHRGRKVLKILTKGRSSHASQPHLGENAIYNMAEIIKNIESMDLPTTKLMDKKMSGNLCVTRIKSEGPTNVVPNKCEATVDMRTVPKSEFEFDVEGEVKLLRDFPAMITESEDMIEKAENAIKSETGYKPNKIIKPQATDAGFLSKEGTETIILGPGEPGEPHSNNESVDIDLLEDAYRVYKNILKNFN